MWHATPTAYPTDSVNRPQPGATGSQTQWTGQTDRIVTDERSERGALALAGPHARAPLERCLHLVYTSFDRTSYTQKSQNTRARRGENNTRRRFDYPISVSVAVTTILQPNPERDGPRLRAAPARPRPEVCAHGTSERGHTFFAYLLSRRARRAHAVHAGKTPLAHKDRAAAWGWAGRVAVISYQLIVRCARMTAAATPHLNSHFTISSVHQAVPALHSRL